MNQIKLAIELLHSTMKDMGRVVHTDTWQGVDISKNPHAKMVELLHRTFSFNMTGVELLDHYRGSIKPNLPWADDHFDERVCGLPINPGTEWANWPWAVSAKDALDENGMFNHNYMERYWPKLAGSMGTISTKDASEFELWSQRDGVYQHGIRGVMGDLDDVIKLMVGDPLTRQAFLPVWFPEDTGSANPGRKPCTLGYHFIMRNNQLDVVYYIRSCDLHRHFQDDVYLTVRLLLWVLNECRRCKPEVWDKVKPGMFIMHITSLHMFIADFQLRYKRNPL